MDFDKVLIDDLKASEKATRKLIQKGRRHIAFLSTINNLNVGKLRYEGYKNAMNDAYGNFDEGLSLYINSSQDIQEQVYNFLKVHSHIDGIVAADNTSGTVSINIAKSMELEVPDDVSIIGFADQDISNLSVPKLAYVDQQAELMGSAAVKLCLSKLKGVKLNGDYDSQFVDVKINEEGSL